MNRVDEGTGVAEREPDRSWVDCEGGVESLLAHVPTDQAHADFCVARNFGLTGYPIGVAVAAAEEAEAASL